MNVSKPFFTEPHGYGGPDLGPLTALRHPRVSIEDGFVMVAELDGRAWRCYFDGDRRVELPGTVTRAEGELWLLEREALFEYDDWD